MNTLGDSRPESGPQIVLIVGPTAAGKTALAIEFAEAAGGEIISADSQQVYRGMDIGTGKATAAERARVPHHLIDIVAPNESMSAATWSELADRAIDQIVARGKLPIVVGGSGLYVRALMRGLFGADGDQEVSRDDEIRARLRAEVAEVGPEQLHARLSKLDPASAERIAPRDAIRIVRALEVFELTGAPLSRHTERHGGGQARYRAVAIGLSPPVEERRARIDARCVAMVEAGLKCEVERLIAEGYGDCQPLGALGYRHFRALIRGEIGAEQALSDMQRDTRRYARRQLAWYRHDDAISWYTDAKEAQNSALQSVLDAKPR